MVELVGAEATGTRTICLFWLMTSSIVNGWVGSTSMFSPAALMMFLSTGTAVGVVPVEPGSDIGMRGGCPVSGCEGGGAGNEFACATGDGPTVPGNEVVDDSADGLLLPGSLFFLSLFPDRFSESLPGDFEKNGNLPSFVGVCNPDRAGDMPPLLAFSSTERLVLGISIFIGATPDVSCSVTTWLSAFSIGLFIFIALIFSIICGCFGEVGVNGL